MANIFLWVVVWKWARVLLLKLGAQQHWRHQQQHAIGHQRLSADNEFRRCHRAMLRCRLCGQKNTLLGLDEWYAWCIHYLDGLCWRIREDWYPGSRQHGHCHDLPLLRLLQPCLVGNAGQLLRRDSALQYPSQGNDSDVLDGGQ